MQYDVAVQTVIDLNERYKPFAIYADKGAGEYQIEMLRKHIGEKVKGVFYGSTIEVKDPESRVMEKKSLKPFLINQTTLLLERGQLRIPHEEVKGVIAEQMMDYRVVKISEKTKEPVYSSVNEHGLDAMVFGLYAFMEHHPELVNTVEKVNYAREVGLSKGVYFNPVAEINLNAEKAFSKNSKAESNDEPNQPRYRRVPLGFSKRKGSSSANSMGWSSNKVNKNPWKGL